jgi:UrcA family protein
MKHSMTSKLWISAAILLATGVPALALASVPDSTRDSLHIRVSYADLDLDKEAGIEQLYQRLKFAVSNACGSATLYGAGSVKQARDNKACYRDLLDRAVRKADNAALSKRHSG